MTNPLKAVMNVRKEELPLSLLMFVYFFLVITSFWILKPIKKSVFIEYYEISGFDLLSWHLTASQAELLAKVLNMVVAFLAVTVFTLLARTLRREQLTYIFTLFFLGCYALYGFFLDQPGDLLVWSFYLFGDLFSTLMVATFFAFLNDSVTPDRAKRIYGLVGLGGVTGGAFGSTIVMARIDAMSGAQWMWACAGLAVLIMAVAAGAGRLVNQLGWTREAAVRTPSPQAVRDEPRSESNAALEGARLVLRSRYLLAIVAIVGLYEVVSTILDFQFTATVVHFLEGPEIGRHFARIYAITNWTAMFVQFFLTSLIMSRFGLSVALGILPIMVLMGSTGFLVFPILWVGSFLNTADNGFSYSINQSAKEALYVPTTRDQKYKAKAFIDMFVQRFAKVLAVVISLGITSVFRDFSSVRWLGLFTVGLVLIWIYAVRYAGRTFRHMTEDR